MSYPEDAMDLADVPETDDEEVFEFDETVLIAGYPDMRVTVGDGEDCVKIHDGSLANTDELIEYIGVLMRAMQVMQGNR